MLEENYNKVPFYNNIKPKKKKKIDMRHFRDNKVKFPDVVNIRSVRMFDVATQDGDLIY